MTCSPLKTQLPDHDSTLLSWQKKTFRSLILALLIAGALPYAAGFGNETTHFNWLLAGVYLVVYIAAVCIALMNKIHFALRVGTGLAIFYLLGIISLLAAGALGTGLLYLICFCTFASLFSTLRTALLSLAASVTTLVTTGLLINSNILDPARTTPMFDLQQWFIFTASFTVIGCTAAISLSRLINTLVNKNRLFQHLSENSSDIIWSLDQDRNISFVNSRVSSVLGYHPKDWIGRPMSRLLDETGTRQLEQHLSANDSFCMQTIIRHHNQTPVIVEIRGRKLCQIPDTPSSYQGTIKDITRIKQLEDEHTHLKKRMDRDNQLKNLGMISGTVAHDLNNILSGTASYPEVLLMDANLEPDIEKGLKIIRDSGHQASAIVSDLLAISRGPLADKEMININSLLNLFTQSRDYVKIKNRYPQVSIELQLTSKLPEILGAYNFIEKAVMNLLLNAVEEAAGVPDGQVVITTANCSQDDDTQKFSHQKQGDFVVLSVTDNGIGISKEDQGKIFTPFYTSKEMGKIGTGLGMVLVKSTVLDHKGYLDMTSSNNGTRFDLFFPAGGQEMVV